MSRHTIQKWPDEIPTGDSKTSTVKEWNRDYVLDSNWKVLTMDEFTFVQTMVT